MRPGIGQKAQIDGLAVAGDDQAEIGVRPGVSLLILDRGGPVVDTVDVDLVAGAVDGLERIGALSPAP